MLTCLVGDPLPPRSSYIETMDGSESECFYSSLISETWTESEESRFKSPLRALLKGRGVGLRTK